MHRLLFSILLLMGLSFPSIAQLQGALEEDAPEATRELREEEKRPGEVDPQDPFTDEERPGEVDPQDPFTDEERPGVIKR